MVDEGKRIQIYGDTCSFMLWMFRVCAHVRSRVQHSVLFLLNERITMLLLL